MITEIYIGTDRLDLYEDENIVITSKVANIQDVDKIQTDFGLDINIPASHRNNKILNHWYDSSSIGGFDNRVKQPGKISIGGGDFRYGSFNIANCTIKNGVPSNYNLNYVGNLISLKDKLDNDKLNELDFSHLEFEYNVNNVINKLENEDSPLISTLFSDKQLIYDSSNGTTQTEKLSNIYLSNSSNGINWYDLKFSLKCIAIIEAIESKYDIVFSRGFLSSIAFDKLYLLLSGDSENDDDNDVLYTEIITLDDVRIDNLAHYPDTVSTTNGNTTLYNTVLASDEKLRITVRDAIGEKNYNLVIKQNDVELYRFDNLKGYFRTYIDNVLVTNLTFFIESKSIIYYDCEIARKKGNTDLTIERISHFFSYNNLDYSIYNNMPDMTCIDFLDGIFKVFKNVAIPDPNGDIYLDTLQDYYKKGNLIEIENFIDISSISVLTPKEYSDFFYTFEDPSTILAIEYNKTSTDGYGNLREYILDDNGNAIDGESKEIKVSFEQIIYERIVDVDGQGDPGVQYGLLADEEVSPTDISAHIHYVENLSTLPIKITDANTSLSVTTANCPSHTLGLNEPLYSTVFGQELNEYTLDVITNTLYSNYHKNTIEKITNKRTRYYKINAKNVPVRLINSIKLNDVLKIKNEYFRIDKMDVNIITRDIVFYLFNDTNLESYRQPITMDRNDITFDNGSITFDLI